MAVAIWSVLIGHPALKRSSRSCKHAPTVGHGQSQWGREEHTNQEVFYTLPAASPPSNCMTRGLYG